MSTTIQMNTRIDRDLKSSGDAALALIGFTPSQAVRALWEKAARRGKDLEDIEALLAPSKHSNGVPDSDIIRQGWGIADDFRSKLTVAQNATADEIGDDELLEQALHDCLVERGLA